MASDFVFSLRNVTRLFFTDIHRGSLLSCVRDTRAVKLPFNGALSSPYSVRLLFIGGYNKRRLIERSCWNLLIVMV